jgi:hypothetical protein
VAATRTTERFWLRYTPVWAGFTGLVMVGGWAERWTDVPLLLFGLAVALPAVIGPFVVRTDDGPLLRSPAVALLTSVVGLAVGLNYTQTPYFWDVLHMHYGFQSTWNIDHNPVFLYNVTIAYFATYCALCLAAWRWLQDRGAGWLSWVLAPLAMALLETVLNANPFTTRLFCYDDMPLMLWFGTLSYGVAFVFALPMWVALSRGGWSVGAALVMCGGVLYADLLVLDVLRYEVAPYVTTVEPDAVGLRDYDTCLVRPEEDR